MLKPYQSTKNLFLRIGEKIGLLEGGNEGFGQACFFGACFSRTPRKSRGRLIFKGF
jgi:hypothetical protein